MEENAYIDNLAIDDNKLSLSEFEEKFLEYIPETLLSNRDIDNNRDWSDMIIQEAWRLYIYSGVDKGIIFKLSEQIFFAYKRYKPNLD